MPFILQEDFHDVIDHFKVGGCGWQTPIDEALREWIREHDTA